MDQLSLADRHLSLADRQLSLADTGSQSHCYSIIVVSLRYLARPLVAQQLASAASGRFSAVDRAVAEGGWRIVLLCRLSPLFPFALSNYLFGVTGTGEHLFLWWSSARLGIAEEGTGRPQKKALVDRSSTPSVG